MSDLADIAQAVQLFAERVDRSPLEHIRWLPAQHRFLSSTAPRKLFRAGNQAQGKTTAGLGALVHRCLGTHPFLNTKPPPINCIAITASWSQGLAIQQKLFDLLPADVLHPDTEFDPVRGFRGRNPATRFRNGSVIRWKTTQQGALQLAGSSVDVALFDEPPTSPRIYSEVNKRLLRAGTGGALLLAMTPVNAPVDWIRELCEQGQIADIHSPLTPEAMIPVGHTEPLRLEDGTPCDDRWIEQVRAESLPYEVPVTVDGEWQFSTADAVFSKFNPDHHVSTLGPVGPAKICIGVDFGSKIGKQVAILCAVQTKARGDERVWVLDESVGGSETSIREDARDILAMLKRQGLQWRDVDHAFGDRLYISGKADRKSNSDLMREVARELGISKDRLKPKIRTVKRGRGRSRGSVATGARYLHQLMISDRFRVHPRCENLLKSLMNWCWTEEEKDKIDALRYCLNSYVFGSGWTAPKPMIRIG